MLQRDQKVATCLALQEKQVFRKAVIDDEVSITNRMTSIIARYCGFDPHAEEETRKEIWDRAEGIMKRAIKVDPQDKRDLAIVKEVAEDLDVRLQMLEPLIARRTEIEQEMERLASLLPGFEITTRTPGFKALGFAVIVGEAGDLSRFASVRRLWSFLGYGMKNGHEKHAYTTWRRIGGMAKEDRIEAGYSAKPLSKKDWKKAKWNPDHQPQIYGVVTVPLFMAKSKNKYGGIYAARRARTAVTNPDWTKKHSDEDGRRIMTKALLLDVWLEWRRTA